MMGSTSPLCFHQKPAFSITILFIICLSIPSPWLFAAEPISEEGLQITLNRAAKTVIFLKTAILPFGPQDAEAPLLREYFHSELDRTGKYELLSPNHIDQLLKEHVLNKAGIQSTPYAISAGRHLRCRGVITGKIIQGRPKPLPLNQEDKPGRNLQVTMLDIQTNMPVWTFTLPLPEERATGKILPAATQELISKGVQQLFQALLDQGAIHSTRIPKPSILSKQGLIRGSRIVLRPAPLYEHSSYQLLRSKTADGLFKPVGTKVTNNGTPPVLEDTGLEDATTYYYTISGIAPSGLASIPQPPFSITTTGAPQPVPSFNATGNGLRQILLSWELSPDPNVTGYTIYRSSAKADDFLPIVDIDDPDRQSYLDRGGAKSYERFGKLNDNTKYFYYIRSRNNVAVESENSATVSAVTKGPPIPPTGLKAIDRQPGRVSLSWQKGGDPHTKGYTVFRAQSPSGPFTKIAFIGGRENTEYVDDGSFTTKLENNTRYYYRIQTVNVVDISSEESATISAVTKPAPVPVLLQAPSRARVKEIFLHWHPSKESDIAFYEIFRSTTPENITTRTASLPADKTEYVDTGLPDGTTYWYKVRAVDYDKLKGLFSNPLQGETKPRPLPPTGLHAQATDKEVKLRWTPNREKDIVAYTVLRLGFLNKTIKRVPTNHLVVTEDLEPGKEYRFQVTAVDADGLESEGSEIVKIKLQASKNPESQ